MLKDKTEVNSFWENIFLMYNPMHIKCSLVSHHDGDDDDDNSGVYCIPGPQGDHGKVGEK